MGRSPYCDEGGLKKGPWTTEEDEKLVKYIQKHGHESWKALPKLAGLNRCGKSCRLRWTNYLRPDIKRGKFTQEEEQTILNMHAIIGNKWSAIATRLPGRTDNEIKNFWNTHLKKKLIRMGFDPMTHQPRPDIFSSLPHLIALAAGLKELIENPSWEEQAMRLQAGAVQMARLNHYFQSIIQRNLQNNMDFNLLNATPSASFPAEAGLFLPESVEFSHLPDLQTPTSKCGDLGAVTSQGDNSPPTWLQENDSPLPPSAVAVMPPLGETSVNNTVDGCSSSGYGVSGLWSELLNDPIFQDM